ncbi:MAG: hypothetical protein IJH37_12975 [Clostridia bacterium]|nr:hypothetical protein [Clostridia bacterium]
MTELNTPELLATRLYNGTYLCMELTTTAIDAVYNKSTVQVRLYVTNKTTPAGTGNASCYIDGSARVSFTMNITGAAWSGSPDCTIDENTREREIYNETHVIQHDTNGKRTVRMCAEIYDVTVLYHDEPVEMEYEGICSYIHLVDIPQASEFAPDMVRDVTVNGTNKLNIGINPLDCRIDDTIDADDTVYRHDLVISLGEYSETICNITSSVSFTVPVSWLAALPAAEEMTGLITLRTFNSSGDEVGDAVQTYWTAHVPENAVPTISGLTIEQIQGSFPLSFGWVQYASRAHLEITGAASAWGAHIVGYSIKGCGYSGAEDELDTGTLNYSGTQTFQAYVTDSRGKTSAISSVSISVQKYTPPRFLSVLSQRCDRDGTLNNEGSYLKSLVGYEFDSFGGLNSIQSAAVYYKRSNADTYTQLNTAFTNGTPVVNTTTVFNIAYAYDIRYKLTDRFGTSYYDDVLSKSHISMEFLAGGRGIAFGKEAEVQDAADFGYKIYARRGVMPIEIAKTGNLANNINIRNYSLFAIKTTLCSYWLLGFRALTESTIKASFSQPGYDSDFRGGYVQSYSALLNISNDGDSITSATVEYGSIQPGGSYTPTIFNYDSGTLEHVTQIYALI